MRMKFYNWFVTCPSLTNVDRLLLFWKSFVMPYAYNTNRCLFYEDSMTH